MDDRYTIDTPENIEFAYDIAGIGSRFLAATIDTLLIGIAETIVILIVGLTSSALGYQSGPRMSLLAGVTAVHQVVGDMPEDRVRTLASPSTTTIVPECGEADRVESQTVKNGEGCCCHFEFGPMELAFQLTANDGCQVSPSQRAQRLPWLVHRPYFSANRMVLDVPSWNVAGMRAAPNQSVRPNAALLVPNTCALAP